LQYVRYVLRSPRALALKRLRQTFRAARHEELKENTPRAMRGISSNTPAISAVGGCHIDGSQGKGCCNTTINVEFLQNTNMKQATKLEHLVFGNVCKIHYVPRQNRQSYFKLQDYYGLRINKAFYIPQTSDEITKLVTSLISNITARRKN
jgi:hypothetical protein